MTKWVRLPGAPPKKETRLLGGPLNITITSSELNLIYGCCT
jgi:hypothetical protein